MTRTFSPLLLLMLGAFVFEYLVRLPYVLHVSRSPEMGNSAWINAFSSFPAAEIIFYGLTLTTLTLLVVLGSTLIAGAAQPYEVSGSGCIPIPSLLHVVAAFTIAAAGLAILSIGINALFDAFSSKRSELGERGLTWVLLKIAVFNHFIACLYFIRMSQTRSMVDRIMFVATIIALILPALVFSQRSILIVFFLEIVYLQLLLGSFRVRRVAQIGLVVFATLLLVSILRPSVTFSSNFEAIAFGLEKIAQSRYFFDFTKLGNVYLWASDQNWLGPISVGFILEPFFGDDVLFYKEIGPLIAERVYFFRAVNGITPGVVLESLLSFGLVFGFMFFGGIVYVAYRLERRIFTGREKAGWAALYWIIVLGKFPLLLNSSLGAFAFQLVLDSSMFMGVMMLLSVRTSHRRNVRPTLNTRMS